jgi:hypothetical protein
MMQSAQTRRRNHGSFRRRLLFGRSAIGRVFTETIVNSIFVIVVHVIADQPAEMWFAQGDNVTENLAPATSHPFSAVPFCHGAFTLVRLGFSPVPFRKLTTS